jgi:hypothetical protein
VCRGQGRVPRKVGLRRVVQGHLPGQPRLNPARQD